MCKFKKLSEWINDQAPEKTNVWITVPENKIISSVKRPERLEKDTKIEDIKNPNDNSYRVVNSSGSLKFNNQL